MYRSALMLCAFAVFSGDAEAQTPPDTEHVDRIMERYDRDDVPGVVVAVVRSGEVVFSKGYGMANLEHGLAMQSTTVNDLGSVSKQFTAFAIAMLAQQGRLSLDDDIRTHFPEIPDLGATVRVRHLIHHISGIREIYDAFQMAGWQGGDRIAQEDALRLMVRQRELNFPPGDRYLYCNTAYMLLAELVTRVTGQVFSEWMQSNVFSPLGMTHTTIMAEFGQVIPGVATSYREVDGHFLQIYDNSTIQGAGGMYSTVHDLAKWIGNFANPVVGDAHTVTQVQQRGILTNGDTLSYAFGIAVGEYRGLRRLQHTGSSAGYRAWLAYFPEVDVGIVTLSNAAGFDRGTQNLLVDAVLADHVAPASDHAIPSDPDRDPDPVPTAPVATSLAEYAGIYYSPELETVYTFDVVNGRLMASHRRYDSFEVTFVTGDEFDGPPFLDRIHFERDAAGRVSGLRASNSRVKNMWFEKWDR